MEDVMFKGVNILIAEDSEINYFLLKEFLVPTGANHFWAKNGLEAIEILNKNENILLILMDISMPTMDGITATRKIREKKINIPIIFQTAFDTNDNKEECLKAGGNDFLSKPLSKDRIYSVIKKYLTEIQSDM